MVLDSDLKPDVLKEHLRDAMAKIETKLKKIKVKVVVFFVKMD